MKRHTPLLLAAASLCIAFGCTAPAAAQLDHLNVDRLIKEMRERGMSELLVRLAKDGTIKDPADAKKLEVEMLIMRAQTPVPGNVNDLADRVKALEDGMTQFQALINQYRDSTKRPLWQADMALHLIYTRMTLNNLADDFYEFGVPTAEQTAVFESGAALSAESLIDASVALSRLQRDLPRAADYNQTYVNTGRWEEMMDEYLKTKVPFLLGQAAYLAALLPDSHPYYQNLGKNPNVPLQAATPAAERTRLLNMAVDALSNIPTEMTVKFGLPARPMNLVKGKALARLGKFEEALALLDGVAAQPKDDVLAFRAQLAKAVLLELKDKKPDAANVLLEGLKDHPLTQGGIAFPIVITDLQHRLLLKHAGADKNKIETAYTPYDALFTDKRLGQRIEATRMFVYQRWTKLFGGQKQDALPPMVLSGMGEMERLLGNEQVANWNNAKETKPEEAERFMKVARAHLDKCIDICDLLIDRVDVAPEVKARARYNKAYASYLKDPEDGSAFLRAASIWTELANELPKHPLAEEAIGLAIRFLHNLHIQENRSSVVDEAYRNSTAVLYTKLPDTQVAEDERTYYTFNVLQSAGKYKEAAASYEKVSPQHRDYVEAQREWMFCHVQLWRAMPEGPEKAARRDVLRDEVGRIERVARKEFEDSGEANRRQMFKTTLGDLVLTRVELDMHRKSWDDADRALRNFASDYPDEPDLIRLAMARRIMVKVKQGVSAEAVKLAEELMKEAGDDAAKQSAAASTIDAALGELAEEIEDLRAASEVAKGELDKKDFMDRATSQAEASDKLADMLLRWATANKVEEDQMFRYRLIKVRSSVLTGRREEAAEVLSALAEAAPDEPRVIFLLGEVAYMTGKREDIIKAIGYFMKITTLIELTRLTPDLKPEDRNKADVLNRVWWQSWLRILQAYDKINAQTAQIPRLVAQLESQHPELGGPGMRTKFQQLANKYRK